MRKPVKSETSKIHVMSKAGSIDPRPPQPPASKGKTGCAPQLEEVRGRMLRQWTSGVRMKSLAVMYNTTKDEVESTLLDRLLLVAPSIRRAA